MKLFLFSVYKVKIRMAVYSSSVGKPFQKLSPQSVGLCPEHKSREVNSLCETCEKMMCAECIDQQHLEIGHTVKTIQDFKESLMESLKPVEDYHTTLAEALKELAKRSNDINHQQKAIEKEINIIFSHVIDSINSRKLIIMEELNDIVEKKQNKLSYQRKRILTLQEKLNDCVKFSRESVKIPNNQDIFRAKRDTNDITGQFLPPLLLEPSEEAKIKFFSRFCEVENVIEQFGHVYSYDVSPENCNVSGLGLEVGTVGKKSSFLLQAIDSRKNLCNEMVRSLESELVSDITDNTIQCSVERRAESLQNFYEISYVPLVKGRHQLHIRVEDEHIKGSPFSVAVNMPSVESIKAPISMVGNLKSPSAVALNSKGRIIICEEKEPCISLYYLSGDRYNSFDIEGTDGIPRGLVTTMDKQECIFVLDAGTNCILKYSQGGRLLAALNIHENNSSQINSLAISPKSSSLYVTDQQKHCIHVISCNDFAISGCIGKRGSGKGEFRCPSGVSCDNMGNIYVADTGNHRIQVFNLNGQFLRKFGKEGKMKGQLKVPTGIVVDDNYVYIGECGLHPRVSVFTCDGQFVHCFGDDGVLCQPRGLTVDSSGVVYVCDSGNNSLYLF